LGLGIGAILAIVLACGPRPEPTSNVLSLVVEGTGSGSLSVGGHDCTESCDVKLSTGASHTVTATPAAGSELASWTDCDDVVGLECTVVLESDRELTATFDLITDGPGDPGDPEDPGEPGDPEDPEDPGDPGDPDDPGDPEDPEDPGEPEDPPARTGDLVVTFSGLPTGIENLGHATITSPTGDVIGILESKSLLDLPVGEYTVDAHGLEVCTSTVQPLAPPSSVTISEGETANLEIVYGGESLSAQGFRAVIRGVHSNGGEVLGYVTVTEEGDEVSVLACFQYQHSGDLDNPSVRHGNPYNVFVEDAPVVFGLSPVEQDCFDTVEFYCYLYAGGVKELVLEETTAFRKGEYYFYAESWSTYGVRMVAQVGSETTPAQPAVGGELVVDIEDMPPEFAGFELCIEGRFTMQEDSFYGEPCLDLIDDAGQTVFSDVFAGAYEAYVQRPAGAPDVPPGLVISGSPVDVGSGEVATISVSFGQ